MNNQLKNISIQFAYKGIVDIWKQFCSLHEELYQNTLSEYQALLKSDIEKVESITEAKEDIIKKIKDMDEQRKEGLKKLESFNFKVEKVHELCQLGQELKLDPANELHNYNLTLLNTIEKLQEQNKTNQFYLNKAIYSINELRDSFKLNKRPKTYNEHGLTKA